MVKRITVLFVLLAICLLPASKAQGAERSYRIDSVEIDARLDGAGNMQVTELDTYAFEGSFNGIVVELNSAGSDGIAEFHAYEVTPEAERPLPVERSIDKSKITYKVAAPSKDEQRRFKLTYQVQNVVQVYQDTAEFYWKFFDQSNPSRINAVIVNLHLPPGVARAELLAYGHGSLAGQVAIQDGGVVQYTVNPLQAGEMLETRVLFPPAYVPQSTRVRSEPGLERIRAEENRWADEADRRRALKAEEWLRILYSTVGIFGANLLAMGALFLKYGKEHRPDWQGVYCRELPAEITPAVMSYLVSYRVQPRDLMATLMDLVRRHYVEMNVVETKGGLFTVRRRDYRFRLTGQEQPLLPHEQELVDWLFGDLAQDGELSLATIQQAAKNRSTAVLFARRWSQWSALVVAEAKEHPWFEKNAGGKVAMILGLLQVVPILFFISGDWKLLFLGAVPTIIFAFRLRRRTQAGATEYRKWQAFKRYVTDYSQLDQRDPLAVHLWEQYLVYAISLGVAKKVIAISHLELRDPDNSHYWLHSTVTRNRLDHREFDHLSSSFNRTVYTARSVGRVSSRGSGGGFSGGGGGGGGGGGRGAF